jgi:hypothetical protein
MYFLTVASEICLANNKMQILSVFGICDFHPTAEAVGFPVVCRNHLTDEGYGWREPGVKFCQIPA